jgi:hypothetical protein
MPPARIATVEASSSAPGRGKKIMDVLIVALSGSDICKVINVGTLRYFIEFTFRDMFNGSTFDLGPLWNVLAAEPGLTPETITPPFLLFKEWEFRLGVTVVLPKGLAEFDRPTVESHLARISIKSADVERALGAITLGRASVVEDVDAGPAPKLRLSDGYLGVVKKPDKPSGGHKAEEYAPREPDDERRRRRGPIVLGVCLAITVAGLGFVGWRLTAEPGKTYRLENVASVLRLEDGMRVDFSVRAFIADPRWEQAPAPERQRILEQLFELVQKDGVRTLSLLDRSGRTRGLISTVGGPRVVRLD